MGKHRETVEIIADILNLVHEGCGKTRIMYGANLSYTLLCKYLSLVCCCGLINNASKNYELTGKGIEFLRRYNTYDKKRKHFAESILELDSKRGLLEQILEFNR